MGKNSAWSFGLVHESVATGVKLQYDDLHEFNMGSPLSGRLTIYIGSKSYTPEDRFGGPPVFNEVGSRIAIPLWKRNRNQQLILVDCINQTLSYLPREFRVLELDEYRNGKILGIDSPAYKPFEFEVNETDFVEYQKF